MDAPQRAECACRVGDPSQRGRHVLGEHRKRHRLHQLHRPIVEAVDVAGHDRAAGTRDPRRPDRRVHVDVVDVDHASGRREVGRQLALAELQPIVAIPQDDALAAVLVDEDDGVLIGHVADHHVSEIDAALLEIAAHALGVVVGAGDADELRAKSQPRARRQRRRDLAAAGDEVMADAHLRQRRGRRGIRGELVDEIDRRGADADDVEGSSVGRRRR
ncbi:MAG: hypothetical protein AUI11_09165 [Acidobacteria bacterium 13_2_20CM_2_66_4]|nr:MAG: hypothetical protein AUI11_09165 [Acidobacteria bacterium 13_2_20CM_2_66_4]